MSIIKKHTWNFGWSTNAVGGELSFTFQPNFTAKTPVIIKSVYAKGIQSLAATGLTVGIPLVRVVFTNVGTVSQPLDNLGGTAPIAGVNPGFYFGTSNSKAKCNWLVLPGQLVTVGVFLYPSAVATLGDGIESVLSIEWTRPTGLNL